METVVKRLKAARETKGWSQERLAAKVGISRGYLARLETGHHDPTLGVVLRMARALRVPLAELVK